MTNIAWFLYSCCHGECHGYCHGDCHGYCHGICYDSCRGSCLGAMALAKFKVIFNNLHIHVI